MFHVSSSVNRASIQRHGLDWTRMHNAPGIAGSRSPEVAGVFLVSDYSTVLFFIRINNTGGPVDVWAVDDVPNSDLIDNGTGFTYVPYPIPPHRLTLQESGSTSATRSPAAADHGGAVPPGGRHPRRCPGTDRTMDRVHARPRCAGDARAAVLQRLTVLARVDARTIA